MNQPFIILLGHIVHCISVGAKISYAQSSMFAMGMICSSGSFIVLQECHWNVNRSSFCQIKVNVRQRRWERGAGGCDLEVL